MKINKRNLTALTAALYLIFCFSDGKAQTQAVSTNDFLNSIGVNSAISALAKNLIKPLRPSGIPASGGSGLVMRVMPRRTITWLCTAKPASNLATA
ncbi:hypothetical protein [Mucilaginibacter antarcticus]|uniref:Uncharacterized protein n=1 Tax=Mucilaginibacter antarcticus TaxID=1855725 RepID=A0ABW5XT49_9SPHI